MRKDFHEALGDLLAQYSDVDPDTLISGLELQLMALKEEASNDEGGE